MTETTTRRSGTPGGGLPDAETMERQRATAFLAVSAAIGLGLVLLFALAWLLSGLLGNPPV